MQQPVGRGLDLHPVLGDLVGIEKVEDVGGAAAEGLTGAPGAVGFTMQNDPLGLGDVAGGDVSQDGQNLGVDLVGGEMTTHGGQDADAGQHGLGASGIDGEILVVGSEGAVPIGVTAPFAIGLGAGVGQLDHGGSILENGLQSGQVLGIHGFLLCTV